MLPTPPTPHSGCAITLHACARCATQRARRSCAQDAPAAVRALQADRLARTYPDLLASPRYGPAATFFLSDLYGPKDFTARDEEVARILPTMTRMLPGGRARDDRARGRAGRARRGARPAGRRASCAGCDPGARALEISEAAYADGLSRHRTSTTERERQIALTGRIGAALDRLARKPLLGGALRLMEAPAYARRAGRAARLSRARLRGLPPHARRRRVSGSHREARAPHQ